MEYSRRVWSEEDSVEESVHLLYVECGEVLESKMEGVEVTMKNSV